MPLPGRGRPIEYHHVLKEICIKNKLLRMAFWLIFQKPAVETHLDKPLEENLNHADPEIVTASNVEDAIAALR